MRNKGFTLLELMLALAITALVITICLGVFHTGVRAWEQGTSRSAASQRLRIVPELLKRQLASACPARGLLSGRNYYYFRGNRDSVEFFSRLSVFPGNIEEKYYVRYVVSDNGEGGQSLFFYERPAFGLGRYSLAAVQDTDFRPLLEGYAEIGFEYLSPGDGEDPAGPWQAVWAGDGGMIPRAVRLTVKKGRSGDSARFIIPIMVTEDEG